MRDSELSDVTDARSKIAAAKRELESAARWEENAEQARIYRHHAEELAVAMDHLEDQS